MSKRIPNPVQCPFYHRDDGHNTVTCEGIMDDSEIILAFSHPEDFEKQMEVFCCQYYEKCELYRAAEDKYEG